MQPETSAALRSIWEQVHSDAGMPFPATIAALIQLGVNRYRVDYVASNVTAYIRDEAEITSIPIRGAKAGQTTWNGEGLVQAIRNAQSGKGNYHDFSAASIAAGVTDYTVYFDGKKVVYNSAIGESHTEWFPGAKQD